MRIKGNASTSLLTLRILLSETENAKFVAPLPWASGYLRISQPGSRSRSRLSWVPRPCPRRQGVGGGRGPCPIWQPLGLAVQWQEQLCLP